MAANYIKDMLSKEVPIRIDAAIANAIIKYVRVYETYGTNINAFASPYMGLTSCVFRTQDRDGFFELFDMDYKALAEFMSTRIDNRREMVFGVSSKSLVDRFISDVKNKLFNPVASLTLGISNSDMKQIIHNIPTIDDNFVVASDPFNVFTVWVTYNILNSKLDNKLKYQTAQSTLLLLHYKFFTSLVNYRFKYPANEAAMVTTYEVISNKFDIKVLGTWKRVMEKGSEDAIDPNGIHGKTWNTFDNDNKILYIITDIQSRLRSKINLFYEAYMQVKTEGDLIGSYDTVGTDLDGNKEIKANEHGIDIAISSVYQDCMSVSRIVDIKAMRLAVALFSAIRLDQLKQFVIAFSEECVKLAKLGGDDKIIKDKDTDNELLVGGHILIQNILQQSYRYCKSQGIDISVPSKFIKGVKDVYTSSRISEPGILQIRDSVARYVAMLQNSTRESTVTALRTAFIVYIVILSLKYIH
jgi:hypothetical protein